MKKISVRQILVLVAVLAVIVVNALANILPINGQNTGDISDSFSIFFVPSGYVFSIWGVIYLFLISFAIYQLLPAQRDNVRLTKAAPWILLGSAANIIWIFLWHYKQFALTLPAMLTLLASLIATYLVLGIGVKPASVIEKLLVNTTFSIYLGWITVATIANVTQVLFFYNWDGFGIAPAVWAAVMLAAAVIVGALMTFTRRDTVYLLVLIWAIVGIAVKFPAEPVVYISSWAAVGVLSAFVIYTLVMKFKK
ncbi:MAG: tryptophan-rich sensory protein [Anaerolineaceae bacterium]|nr:tryptophan-rich sensory protein [Anaerolineaceae bacterium]